ncbi:MAG: hypothetical protein ACLQNE_17555, partial [Thermoguttaceae bacterium]
SVASTASITMNGLERPVKKQRVSPLIPRYYQPLAKRVPGIAVSGPGFRTLVTVPAMELKKTVVALQQLTPPNMQEQAPLKTWFGRIP